MAGTPRRPDLSPARSGPRPEPGPRLRSWSWLCCPSSNSKVMITIAQTGANPAPASPAQVPNWPWSRPAGPDPGI